MKKIEFVAALAEDAAKELGRIEENSGGGEIRYSSHPKQRLRDDLKMIRRITLEIEKELKL